MEAQLFIIGDVHGCFHTFREMVQKHWRPLDEHLVQLGDLIDRGLHSPQTVALARSLSDRFPSSTHFLKGNHEFEAHSFFEHRRETNWLEQGGADTIEQYRLAGRNINDDLEWLKIRPLTLESTTVMVSHAGITETPDPLRENNSRGVLWNRTSLKRLNKLQVIGHTPCAKPEFREAENVWNVDTGVYKGNGLSAIRVGVAGNVMDIITIPTQPIDYIAAS